MHAATVTAFAGIAKWDVPDNWPELLGQLVGVINERSNAAAVDGAVRCLATFVEDLDGIQLVQVMLQDVCMYMFALCKIAWVTGKCVSAYKQIKLGILRTGPFKVIAKHPVTGKVGQVLLMVKGV